MKKILKGFFAALITAIIVTSSIGATKLYPGEKIVDGKIVGNTIISPADGEVRLYMDKNFKRPNFFILERKLNFFKKIIVQFQPSCLTNSSDRCNIVENKHIKQAWIDYNKKTNYLLNKYVCEGPIYTKEAEDIHTSDYYFGKISIDSLSFEDVNSNNINGGWFYFEK